MKKKIDFTNVMENKERIGAILRGFRETNELSQRDVATKLNYVNVNFISMIETGRSSPPLGKLVELKDAFQADAAIVPVVLKFLYPDAWGSMIGAIHECPDLFGCSIDNKVDSRIEAKFLKLIKEYS